MNVVRPMGRWFAAALAALAAPALAGMIQEENATLRPDSQLESVLTSLGAGSIDAALAKVDAILARYPNFRLAQLVRGDLLLARTRPITAFGSTGHAKSERLAELRAEALVRLRARESHPGDDLVPRYLLRVAPQTKTAIVIDAGQARVYVYENAGGGFRMVNDYYTTIGKRGVAKEREGDQKTPIGVYRVVSYIPGKKLPDEYGWGAFPIDYPNEWDRVLGRTGNGIWLHGVSSDTYARAPLASNGCVSLANPDIAELSKRVQTGDTPVIIADRVEWVPAAALAAERDAFLARLEAWRADWESGDIDRFLANYGGAFRAGGMDLAAWKAHKRRMIAAKKWIKVSLNDVNVFRSPGAPNLITVSFEQDYRSDKLSERTRKRQFWVLEDGRWKIAYEGQARKAKVTRPES